MIRTTIRILYVEDVKDIRLPISKPIDIEKVDAAIKETLNRQTQEGGNQICTSFQGGT